MSVPHAHTRPGFTLIELLVVIAIVAVLAGLLMPALSAIRAAGAKITCTSNQRQFMMGILAYAQDWDDRTPPADGSVAGGKHAARHPHLMLMYFDLLPRSALTSTGTWGGCTWDYGFLRWPNGMSCPANRPPTNPTNARFYSVRWNTAAPSPDAGKHGAWGIWRVADLSQEVPYLGESAYPFALLDKGASGYWISVSPNWGSIPWTLHRGQAVMAYVDGRVQARTGAQLLGEDCLRNVYP